MTAILNFVVDVQAARVGPAGGRKEFAARKDKTRASRGGARGQRRWKAVLTRKVFERVQAREGVDVPSPRLVDERQGKVCFRDHVGVDRKGSPNQVHTLHEEAFGS